MNLINSIKITMRYWWQAWLLIGSAMNWVMTRVILVILFFGILTPLALIARLMGKQFLDIQKDHPQKSYWRKRAVKSFDKKTYEHQF